MFLTSISPKHILESRQQEATKSWLTHGEVISFNHPDEIEIIKSQGYDPRITFMPTYRTQKAMFGKHYVCINEITDFIKRENIQGCMINSDISIDPVKSKIQKAFASMSGGFVYLNRWDFSDNRQPSIYKLGIDAFFFNKEMAETLPQTSFCLGHCFFDIWLPYHFLINQYPIVSMNEPVIYHKLHNVQYNEGHWFNMGQHAALWMGQPSLHPRQVARKIYNALEKHTIWI